MTVCTPHSFAGPHECPYCRCAELEVELANTQYRLAMAVNANPESLLSKHNAMLMACEQRDALQTRIAELERITGEQVDELVTAGTRIAQLEAGLTKERNEHSFSIRTQTMQLVRERDDALARVKGGVRHRESIQREWAAERATELAETRIAQAVAELEALREEIDGHRGHIAELERTCTAECGSRVEAVDAAYELQTRIAQAVAELEALLNDSSVVYDAHAAVRRALAHLRGKP